MIDVTPHKAEAFLHLNTFAGQRPLDGQVVTRYANYMKECKFRVAEIALAMAPDGVQYLFNGQHVCNAGILSGCTFKASYQEYVAPTNTDLWRLFGTFDTHRGRSETNIIKAARGLFVHQELSVIPLAVLKLTGAALLYLGEGTSPRFGINPLSKSDKPELVDAHTEETLLVHSYVMQSAFPLRVAVVVALLATFRANAAKAQEFWDRVTIGDNLKRGTPQYNLHKYLIQPTDHNRGGLKTHTRYYKTCVAWWNSFVDGTNRRVVNVQAMKSLPEVKG